jgi:hypothetical protein
VRLSGRTTREEIRDLGIELDWLTVGESPIIRFAMRASNLRACVRRLHLEAFFSFSLASDPRALVLRGEGYERKPSMTQSFCEGTRWGLLTDPATGASVSIASDEPHITLVDLGQHGRMLGWDKTARLPSEGVLEMAAYFCLGDTPDEALQFRALAEGAATT